MNRKEQKKENFEKMLRLSFLVESLSVATSSQQALIRKEIKRLREELGLTIRNTPKAKVPKEKTIKPERVVKERINKERLKLTVDEYLQFRMRGFTKKDIATELGVNQNVIYYFCNKHEIYDERKLIADYLQRGLRSTDPEVTKLGIKITEVFEKVTERSK